MEYGIFISQPQDLPVDPRSLCAGDWGGILPSAPLKAVYFGSEFCPDLLPNALSALALCVWAEKEGVDPVLLTPLVTFRGLDMVERLLWALDSGGCAPDVVFNDWGVLTLLRRHFPKMRRRAGRLMNRSLRDPRLLDVVSPSPESREDVPSRLRSLLIRSGVCAVETDADLDGRYFEEKAEGIQRTLHFPYVFAASGRNCLVKADCTLKSTTSPSFHRGEVKQNEATAAGEGCFTKGIGFSCSGFCRGRTQRVVRDDTDTPIWRSGNTVFYEVSCNGAAAYLARADRIVVYKRPTA